MTDPRPTPPVAEPWVEVTASRYFSSWLADQKVSLAFTTYQVGKLFFLGRGGDGALTVFERTFNRCMGLWGDGQTLWMSSLYQLWRFEKIGPIRAGRPLPPRLNNSRGHLVEQAGREV